MEVSKQNSVNDVQHVHNLWLCTNLQSSQGYSRHFETLESFPRFLFHIFFLERGGPFFRRRPRSAVTQGIRISTRSGVHVQSWQLLPSVSEGEYGKSGLVKIFSARVGRECTSYISHVPFRCCSASGASNRPDNPTHSEHSRTSVNVWARTTVTRCVRYHVHSSGPQKPNFADSRTGVNKNRLD